MQDAGLGLALHFPALQWQKHDFECIFSRLKYILQLSLVKFSVSLTFFWMEWDVAGRTDTWTDICTGRLFSENIIIDLALGAL